jgi:hypothetical protein
MQGGGGNEGGLDWVDALKQAVRIMLYMCPHTTIYVSSYDYMCPHTTIYVSSYDYMCPRTTIYVSSYEALKQAVDNYDTELTAAAIPPLTGPGATHLAQVF